MVFNTCISAFVTEDVLCEYQEGFNENASGIFQEALNEAYQWQLNYAFKVPTRKRNVKKGHDDKDKRISEEKKKHKKTIIALMKKELKEWEGSQVSSDSDLSEMSGSESQMSMESDDEGVDGSETEVVSERVIVRKETCPSCHQDVLESKTNPPKTATPITIMKNTSDESSNSSIYSYLFMEHHLACMADNQKTFICPYFKCKQAFYTNFEMDNHIHDVHLSTKKTIGPFGWVIDEMKFLPCDIAGCDDKFFGEGALLEKRKHIESVHLNSEGDETNASLSETEESDQLVKSTPSRRGRGKWRRTPSDKALSPGPAKRGGRGRGRGRGRFRK